MTRGALTRRRLRRAPADFTVPAAELIGALALVLADVVEAGPAVQTGAGGARVRLPCEKTRKLQTQAEFLILVLPCTGLSHLLQKGFQGPKPKNYHRQEDS